jgi:hypothetical protein
MSEIINDFYKSKTSVKDTNINGMVKPLSKLFEDVRRGNIILKTISLSKKGVFDNLTPSHLSNVLEFLKDPIMIVRVFSFDNVITNDGLSVLYSMYINDPVFDSSPDMEKFKFCNLSREYQDDFEKRNIHIINGDSIKDNSFIRGFLI